MSDRSKRYHEHCDACGHATQHDEPTRFKASCPRCGAMSVACTDMDTGEDFWAADRQFQVVTTGPEGERVEATYLDRSQADQHAQRLRNAGRAAATNYTES